MDIPELTPSVLATELDNVTVIDVREDGEVAAGFISNSVHIPLAAVSTRLPAEFPDRTTPLVICCAVGARSAKATRDLLAMGYTDVRNLTGGFNRWKGEGLPWERASTMSEAQLERYARHVVIPEVGVAGQERLLASRALIIGAGGLGSPVALYLAAAGVGTIGIVDFDVVEASNLQRQVMHTTQRVGTPKVDSAAVSMQSINPDVTVVRHGVHLDASNVMEVMAGYDVVIDATDSFPTRYLVNDASLRLGVPVVHGSIFRFDGQVTLFDPWRGPCYRCLFPAPPPPELAPNCATAGVLGVLPGVVGSLQAVEALKVLLGIGEPLAGRLLLYDALSASTDEVRFSRDRACPACSDPRQLPVLVDYDETCTPAVRS